MFHIGNRLGNESFVIIKTHVFHTKMVKFGFIIDQIISNSQSGFRAVQLKMEGDGAMVVTWRGHIE